MRTAYREELDSFAHDLIVMCDAVSTIMTKASRALLTAELAPAEAAITLSDNLEELRAGCEARAVRLLALENPLAKDLRQVISSIYIVEDLHRMGKLAKHIAGSARRNHPDPVIPEGYEGYFEELTRLVTEITNRTREVLVDPQTDVALELTTDDDAVDDINLHLLNQVTNKQWKHSTRSAVDVALLSRFYERYADHCVNVAARIVYLITGMSPDEYLQAREDDRSRAEWEDRFAALERQLKR